MTFCVVYSLYKHRDNLKVKTTTLNRGKKKLFVRTAIDKFKFINNHQEDRRREFFVPKKMIMRYGSNHITNFDTKL